MLALLKLALVCALIWNTNSASSSAIHSNGRISSRPSSSPIAPLISGSEYLDSEQKYLLNWNVNTEEERIYFEVTAENTGFIGFGLSPNGGMQGADILIAGVRDNGDIYFSDYHGVGNTRPVEDNIQDWNVTFGEETATHTTLRFHRLLNTCDDDDFKITDATMRVIWSLGETDEVAYHQNRRGTKSVNFFIAEDDDFDASKYLNHSLLVTREMPSQHTTYWCTMQQLPLFNSKQHVVAFEPVLENPEALAHTHHFIFHRCIAPEGQDPDEMFGGWVDHPGDFCYDQKNVSFPFEQYCSGNMVYVWSKGGKRMVFPENIGLPIPEVLGQRDYYVMEVHYDNPQQLAGLNFRTGGRIFYTSNLREIEAGLMLVQHGTNVALTVPPNTSDYIVSGHCSPECTEALLPAEGVTAFNVLLHAHLAGRKIQLRHFRGDQELEWVDRDDYYDFDFQQNKPLNKWRKIERGDQLTVECTYDSTKAEGLKAVVGGLSSKEEMCQAWQFYYPRQDHATNCGSSQDAEGHFNVLGVTEYTIKDSSIEGSFPEFVILKPDHLAGDYLESVSYKVEWTQEFRERFQQEKRFGDQLPLCGMDVTAPAKYPDNLNVYVPPDECDGVTGGPTTASTTTTPPGNDFEEWMRENVELIKEKLQKLQESVDILTGNLTITGTK